MKIVIVGESPAMPSGFGQQILMLCEGFIANGHEVFLLSGTTASPVAPIPGVREWRLVNINDTKQLDIQIHALSPDVVLIFGCTAFISNQLDQLAAPANCPTFLWLPYEGTILPPSARTQFRGTQPNTVIHLTEFAQKLWSQIFQSNLVIPHGVNLDIWKYDPDFTKEDKRLLRRKWAEKLRFPIWDEDLVILNTDRNIYHKRWDATLDYIRDLKRKAGRRVVLIAHTKKIEQGSPGHAAGYNIPYMAGRYGVEDNIVYSGFEWSKHFTREEMVEMFRIVDFRLTTSSGEGFGIPTIEAAAIGVPQIVNEHTSLPELLGAENPMLCSPGMFEEKMGTLWAVPNVPAMVRKTLEFQSNPELLAYAVESARLHVHSHFSATSVVNTFLNLFARAVENNPQPKLEVTFRWGYRKAALHAKVMGDCCRALKYCTDGAGGVVEIGAFTGTFPTICAEIGIECYGLECNPIAIHNFDERAAISLRPEQSWDAEWPSRTAIVLTDMQDLFLENGGLDMVDSLFRRIGFYDWAFVRLKPKYKWGQDTVPIARCHALLEANDMYRRHDIETLLQGLGNLEHEIWQRAGEGQPIPDGVRKFKEMTDASK